MGYVDFLVLAAHAEGECHLVFDDEFAFLQTGNGGADFLKFATAHSKEVFDYLVVKSEGELSFHPSLSAPCKGFP